MKLSRFALTLILVVATKSTVSGHETARNLAADFCPVGLDMEADSESDWTGSAVSMSGDGARVAVGAPHSDGSGRNAGLARAYEWDGRAWVRLGSDVRGEKYSMSGTAVSISGDGLTLAVGAERGNDYGIGSVRVYRWDGADWNQLGDALDGSDYYGYFGRAVSVSSDGSTVAVGAPGAGPGHAQVWEWGGSSWDMLGGTIEGEGDDEEFGFSVSISNDGRRVAIGAPQNDGASGQDSGQTRVYQWGGNEWKKMGQDIDGEFEGDEAGFSVSLSGDGRRVAIGTPYNVGGGKVEPEFDDNTQPYLWGGHTRVYEWDGASWGQLGDDIDSDGDDLAGHSVSLSTTGSRLVIGAPATDGKTPTGGKADSAGSAQIREWDGHAWKRIGSDVEGDAKYHMLGYAVSISGDGQRVAVGAPAVDAKLISWDGADKIGYVRVVEYGCELRDLSQTAAPAPTGDTQTAAPAPTGDTQTAAPAPAGGPTITPTTSSSSRMSVMATQVVTTLAILGACSTFS